MYQHHHYFQQLHQPRLMRQPRMHRRRRRRNIYYYLCRLCHQRNLLRVNMNQRYLLHLNQYFQNHRQSRPLRRYVENLLLRLDRRPLRY
jgi:hypothetical protein